MESVILVIHLMLAVALVITVLLQQSEGGALGIGGGPTSMMSSRSAANPMTRMTTILAGCFFVTTLLLAWMAEQDASRTSVLDGVTPPAVEQTVPDVPETQTDNAPQVPVSN